ncbi:hypothetical protein J437_LFUL018594 [Ladona fulva]|uniref:C2HC/C3H-type domain-containing protein n=1 Tax=Ladona fulva TaxID=123851 RepID=A0A8K0KUX6_LADFU|nr:hypothetical protein J437_LFUL018594 [Ladona fulva]
MSELGSSIRPSLEENEEPPILIPCTVCGRTFKSESLKKHQVVCQKNATKKRKVFDSMKQRIQGTELAEYISVPVPLPKPKVSVHKGGNKPKIGETSHNTNTPSSSERSRPVVRSNSVSTSTPSRGVGAAFKEERCPHCDRTFGWKAFSRHEEWCREHKTRVAQSQSPAAVLKAKEMLEARIKLKRPTNREKYAHGAGVIGVSPMLHSYHKSTVMDVHHQKISSPKSTVSSSNKENRNKSTPKTSTVSCPGFGTTRQQQVTRKVSAPVKREPSPQKEITHIINPPWDLNISNEEVEESKESSSDSRNRIECQECCDEPFKLGSNEVDLVSDYSDKRVSIGTKGILSAQDLVLENGELKPSKIEEKVDKFDKKTVIIEHGRKDGFKCSSLPSQERNYSTNVSNNQENDINDSSIGSMSDTDHAKISEDCQSGFDYSNSRTQILRINDLDESPQSVESLSKEIFNHQDQRDINQSNIHDDREGMLKFQILELSHGSNDEKQAADGKKRQMNENIKTQQAELIDPIKSRTKKGNTLINPVRDFNAKLSNELFETISNEDNGNISTNKLKEKSKKKIKSLGPGVRSLEQVDRASFNEVSMLMETNPDTFRNHSLASWKNVSGSNCSFKETAEVDKSVVEGFKHLTESQKPMEKDTAYIKNELSTFSPKNINKVDNQVSVTDVREGDVGSKGKRSRLPVPLPKHCIDRTFPTCNASLHAKDHIILVDNGQKSSSDDFKTKYQLNNTFILSDFEKPTEFGMNYLSDDQTPENQSNSFESSCSGTSPEIRKGIILKCYPEDYELEDIEESSDQPIEISSSACAELNECHHCFNEAIICAIERRKNSLKEEREDYLTMSLSRESSINEVVSYKFTNLSKTWQRCKRTNVNDVTTDCSKLFHVNNDQSCAKLMEVRKEGTINPNLEGELTTCSYMLPNENDGDNNFSLSDNFNKDDTPLVLEDLSTEMPNPCKQQSTGMLTNDTYILSTAIKKSGERILDVTERSQACEDKILLLERLNSDATKNLNCLYGRKEENESAGNETVSDENQICDPKKFLLNPFSSTTQNLKTISTKGERFRLKSTCKNFIDKSYEREAKENFDSAKRIFCKTEERNELTEKVKSHLNLVRDDLVTDSSVDDIDIINPHVKNSSCYYEKTEESGNFSSIDESIHDYDNVSNKGSPRSKCFPSQKVSLPSVGQKIKHRISYSPRLKYIVGKYSPLPLESSSEGNMGSGNSNGDVLSAERSTTNNILLKSEDEKAILKRKLCGKVFQSPCSEKVENSLKDEKSDSYEASEKCLSPRPIFPTIRTSGERDILSNQMEWLSLVQKFHEQGSNTAESNVDIQKLADCLSLRVCKPFHYCQPNENVQKRIGKQEKLSTCNSIVGKVSNHIETSGLLKNSLSKEETVTEGNQFSLLQRKLAEDRVRKRLAKKRVQSPEKNYRSHCLPRINSPVTPEYLSKKELKSTSHKQLLPTIHLSTNYEIKVRSCQSSPSVSDLHLPKSSEDDRRADSPMEKPSFRLSTYDPFSKAEMQLRELLSDGYESQNPKILLSSPLDEDKKKQVPDNHNSHSSHTDSSHKNGNLHLHNILNNPKQAKEDVLPDMFTETSTQLHFEMPNLMRGREETVMTKRRAMKPTALNMGIDLNPSARENPSMRRNYMSKPGDEKFDSSQEYISSPKDLEGESFERSHSTNSNINMDSGDHLDIESIHQSINLVALGLSNLSTNSNESLVDVDNNNAVSGEKTLAQQTIDVDSSGNRIPVDQKLVLSSHKTHPHSPGESDGDAKRIRRRKRRGKILPEGEAREDISSPESLEVSRKESFGYGQKKSFLTLGFQVVNYCSHHIRKTLNRPSFRAVEDCKRAINKGFDNHQHQNSSEGENDHADEWSEDEDSKKRSSNWKPDPPVIDSTDSKLAKFCHECGSKYPLTQARFCCVCGARRLAV